MGDEKKSNFRIPGIGEITTPSEIVEELRAGIRDNSNQIAALSGLLNEVATGVADLGDRLEVFKNEMSGRLAGLEESRDLLTQQGQLLGNGLADSIDRFNEFSSDTTIALAGLTNIDDAIRGQIDRLHENMDKTFETLSSGITSVLDEVKRVADEVTDISEWRKSAVQFFGSMEAWVKEVEIQARAAPQAGMDLVMNASYGKVPQTLNSLMTQIPEALDYVKGMATRLATTLVQAKDFTIGKFNEITTTFNTFKDTTLGWISEADSWLQTLADGIDGIMTMSSSFWDALWKKIESKWTIVRDKILDTSVPVVNMTIRDLMTKVKSIATLDGRLNVSDWTPSGFFNMLWDLGATFVTSAKKYLNIIADKFGLKTLVKKLAIIAKDVYWMKEPIGNFYSAIYAISKAKYGINVASLNLPILPPLPYDFTVSGDAVLKAGWQGMTEAMAQMLNLLNETKTDILSWNKSSIDAEYQQVVSNANLPAGFAMLDKLLGGLGTGSGIDETGTAAQEGNEGWEAEQQANQEDTAGQVHAGYTFDQWRAAGWNNIPAGLPTQAQLDNVQWNQSFPPKAVDWGQIQQEALMSLTYTYSSEKWAEAGWPNTAMVPAPSHLQQIGWTNPNQPPAFDEFEGGDWAGRNPSEFAEAGYFGDYSTFKMKRKGNSWTSPLSSKSSSSEPKML